MRTFGQVPTKIWRDKRFRALNDETKLAFLSLWCGPDSVSAGVMRLEDGFAALTLDWPVPKWQAACTALESNGLIKRNADTDEILICGFFEVNRPANDRARAVVMRQIDSIECETLRQEADTAFRALLPQGKPPSEPKAGSWPISSSGSLVRGANGR